GWGGWRIAILDRRTQAQDAKICVQQGRTDNSWGPQAIGDHGAPVSLPTLKKAYEKGTRGISWGPLLTPGPRAVPEFPNGQSTPGVQHNILLCLC
ncbi:unnamed protein product, partial [Staurois parvus]